MEDHDDNIFDPDDALDYILYENAEKEVNEQRNQNQSGCLGIIVLLILTPVILFKVLLAI